MTEDKLNNKLNLYCVTKPKCIYFKISHVLAHRTLHCSTLTCFFFCSWKTPQVCLLWAELQAAQLSRGAQGKVSQLPPVHGAAEQHVHRLVPRENAHFIFTQIWWPTLPWVQDSLCMQQQCTMPTMSLLLNAPTGQVQLLSFPFQCRLMQPLFSYSKITAGLIKLF